MNVDDGDGDTDVEDCHVLEDEVVQFLTQPSRKLVNDTSTSSNDDQEDQPAGEGKLLISD